MTKSFNNSVMVSDAWPAPSQNFVFTVRAFERKDSLQSHLDIKSQEEKKIQEPILHTPNFLIAQH